MKVKTAAPPRLLSGRVCTPRDRYGARAMLFESEREEPAGGDESNRARNTWQRRGR